MPCLCSWQTKEALLLALSTVSDGLFVKHAFSSSVMPMTTQIGIYPDKSCDGMIIPPYVLDLNQADKVGFLNSYRWCTTDKCTYIIISILSTIIIITIVTLLGISPGQRGVSDARHEPGHATYAETRAFPSSS